jgi:hypothetical protein
VALVNAEAVGAAIRYVEAPSEAPGVLMELYGR